jgi:nucleotide-binding universal stress UspA family protein
MFKSIVIGTDGSDTAKRAVHEGADVAAKVGAQVHVVTAYQPMKGPKVAAEGTPEGGEWQVGQDSQADAILEEACTSVRSVGGEAQGHARTGDPADAILGLAEEIGADLIVVGNKGLTGARRFLLGSVPDKISHHAPCSVWIVHTTG